MLAHSAPVLIAGVELYSKRAEQFPEVEVERLSNPEPRIQPPVGRAGLHRNQGAAAHAGTLRELVVSPIAGGTLPAKLDPECLEVGLSDGVGHSDR